MIPEAFYFLVFLFLVFGSLLGSFSNVVILRMAEGKSVILPPSSCPHCHHRLSPLDLIPVFGWILLMGKCRYCGAPISVQYPLVEAMAALTLAFAFHASSFSPSFIPRASWGIIWLVVSVLWLRGEVASATPFLLPLVYRIPLSFWAGNFSFTDFGTSIGIAFISSIFVSIRQTDPAVKFAWFGVSASGLVGTTAWGAWFPAGLGLITLGNLLFPVQSGLSPSRGLLFFWSLSGMIACGFIGNWGF